MTLSAGAARLLLVPILLAYGYIAVGYARATPRWNNPDEPAHVNYVRHLATTGTLPVLSEGDWDSDLLARLTTAWFPNDYEVDGLRYEGHQPPLYYLLAAPVYRLTLWLNMPLNRQILALRLFSAVIAAVAVVAAFVVGREAAPDVPVIAVLTAATVAFVPMNTAISAAVNNDCLATALSGVTLAALLIGRRVGFSDRWAIGLGVLIGALVLTKLTVYVYVPLIMATLLLAGWQHARPVDRWYVALRWPLIAAGVALLVAGWWVVRNMLVYGLFDPLAMVRHDQIVIGQPRWLSYDFEALDFFFRILFRSFWGMFGWMALVLDDGIYVLYLVLMVLGIVGLVIGTRGVPYPQPLPRARGRGDGVTLLPSPAHGGGAGGRGLLATAILLVFGEVAYYNLTFIQPQGRYLFPALVPIALFMATGWWQLAARSTDRPIVRLLTAGALAGAVAWTLAEAYGALRAAEIRATDHWLEALWSDQALAATAGIAALLVVLIPISVRRWLPDALCLGLAVGLGLLDLAALVTFVAPAFPHH